MNKLKLIVLALALTLSATSFAADSSDCEYRNDGGYNDRGCHVLNEERLDALEAQQDVLNDALTDGTLKGVKGDQGAQGESGSDGQDGVEGGKGEKGDTGKDGKDGTNGVDGKDFGALDVLSKYREGVASSAAIGTLMQAPHDRSGLAVACASYESTTECAIGGSLNIDDSNHMFNFNATRKIKSVGYSYHFGK